MRDHAGLFGFLVFLGTGWGLTQTLSKIAVSTGHGALGLIFWQAAIGTVLLGVIVLVRRAKPVVTGRGAVLVVAVAFLGTIVPSTLSYAAYVHLPAGIMSIIISAVPLLSFPIAMALGVDRFSALRLAGLLCGFVGVALIAAPGSALPDASARFWLMIALVSPLCYAFEGNVVARWGTGGLDPVAMMFAASAVASVICLPLALATGQFISPLRSYGAPEYALILSSGIHALMYAGYVWLVGRAGSVFAAQTGYLVTGAGVLWAMTLLGERFPPPVWLALAVMFAGIFLVQPRTVSSAKPA